MDVGVEQTHGSSGGRVTWATPTLSACLLLLLLLALGVSARADVGQAAETAEWQRLLTLWHAVLDHSCNAVYSPTLFQKLAADLDKAEEDLRVLADQGLLSAGVAVDLRSLFHGRYEYLKDYHYAKHSRVRLSASAASRCAAWWIIELQLALLRDGSADRDLVEAAKSNIGYQLTFLHYLEKFESEVARRRKQFMDGEKEGKSVDWNAFEADCQRRRNSLLDAYRQRKLPRARSKDALLPYIFALTTTRPAVSVGAAPQTIPPL